MLKAPFIKSGLHRRLVAWEAAQEMSVADIRAERWASIKRIGQAFLAEKHPGNR
jgi:hypothetical protein